MKAIAVAWGDNTAMIGRSLRRSSRDVEALVTAIMLPIVLMLLFVFVFGGAIDTGTYVVPGIILVCAGFGASSTAVAVCSDMVNGIVDRFRSMQIVSSAVLTGHVVASLARNLVAMTLVVAVAIMMGWRPTTNPARWLGAVGMVMLFMLAFSWLSAALGMVARSPDAATGFTFLFLFLPYASSAFVPVDTMPTWLQGFATHQPVTPVIETLRGLLMGGPVTSSAWLAIAWCLAIAALSWTAAVDLFVRRTG